MDGPETCPGSGRCRRHRRTAGSAGRSAGDIVIRRDGSKAVSVPPGAPPPASPDTAGGFQLDDAGISAGTMLALVVGAAGVLRFAAGDIRPVPWSESKPP